MGRVRPANVAVEKQELLRILSVCVRSRSYRTGKAHWPYYIGIYDLSGIAIFSHIIS
jgi:hypothetical protein